MKKQILIILLIALTNFAIGQDLYTGYIISTKGDTTIGQVQFTALFGTKSDIKFFVDGKKVATKMSELIGYGFIESDKYHHFHKIKTHGLFGTSTFLERVLAGKFAVFITSTLKSFNVINNNPEYKITNPQENIYVKENEYYIKNEKGKVYYINFNNLLDDRQKIIKELIANCPKMKDKKLNTLDQDLFFKSLIEYNESCN